MSLQPSLCGRAFVIAACGAALCAQGTQTASVTLTAVDKSGSPVAGARVRLTSPSMMAERSGATNSAGVFVARLLPPGTYILEVVKEGYQTVRVTRAVGMDQHYQPRVIMDAVASATVSVEAAPHQAMDPTDVKTASNFDASRMDALPVPRTIDGVVALSPGVVAGVGGRTQIRGAMTSGNLYLVDGQNLMDNVYANMQYPIMNDSIEETQVITGAISAEYGGVDGGVVNILTKSGSNDFSGQVRADFRNPAWDATRPYQMGEAPDALSRELSVTLGGYFVKDRLWFHVSYFSTDSHTAEAIGGGAPAKPTDAGAGGNALYTNDFSDERRQIKLTYMASQDHHLVATYNSSESDESRSNGMAGDVGALVPRASSFEFWNLAWRATWSHSFTTEFRLGEKRQRYSTWKGRGPQAHDPVLSLGLGRGFYYNMGLGGDDGGDARDNRTANFTGSYHADLAGEHELDFGGEYYRGRRKSRNQRGPSDNRLFVVADYRYDTNAASPAYGEPIAVPLYVVQYPPFQGYRATDPEASQTEVGLFVNDTWKFNEHLSFQLGLRWDAYGAKADDTGGIASASGLSPRLGVSYDPFGDQKWLFKASFCAYESRVMETITGVVSACGNPPYVAYRYTGVGGPWPLSVVYDMDFYRDSMGELNVSGYYVPSRTVGIDPDLEAPSCDEVQVSASHSFNLEDRGRGFLSLTYVRKDWKNLIDLRTGYDGRAEVSDIFPGQPEMYRTVWGNEPDAEREYGALEFAAAYAWKGLNFTGNVTWSSLKGNYEGEGALSPGSGESLHYMDRFRDDAGAFGMEGDWREVYDFDELHPYGYLTGHVPLAVRATADYTVDGKWGRTIVGYRYRYDSGRRYSHTRTVNSQRLSPYFEDVKTPEAMAFDAVFTHYEGFQRNPHSFNSSSYHDLSVTHELPLFKVRGVQARLFAKLAIGNVFNHQQLLSWNTDFEAITHVTPMPEDQTWRTLPWERPATFGDTEASSYWGAPRTYTISLGLRF